MYIKCFKICSMFCHSCKCFSFFHLDMCWWLKMCGDKVSSWGSEQHYSHFSSCTLMEKYFSWGPVAALFSALTIRLNESNINESSLKLVESSTQLIILSRTQTERVTRISYLFNFNLVSHLIYTPTIFLLLAQSMLINAAIVLNIWKWW